MKSTMVIETKPQIRNKVFILPDPWKDLEKVRTPKGYNASTDAFEARFGRDQRQLAAHAMVFAPNITREIIEPLVELQAMRRNDFSEAQRGRFPHEYRELDETTSPKDRQIFEELVGKKRWDVQKDRMAYYGSCDVTPDVVSLIVDYYQKFDQDILNHRVFNIQNNRHVAVKESVAEATQWLIHTLDMGPLQSAPHDFVLRFIEKGKPLAMLEEQKRLRMMAKYQHHVLSRVQRFQESFKRIPLIPRKERVKLLEFQRVNPNGLRFQGWMDGGTSLVHAEKGLEGVLADYSQPIATIEAQGSAYDALMKASYVLPRKAKHLIKLAHEVRDNVLKHFWMEDQNYFAMAVDRDEKRRLRPLKTLAANAAELLNSSLFDELPETERHKYIGSIVNMVFSDEFLTDAGVRTRAKSHASLSDLSKNHDQPNSPEDLWDYQGSETSWIVQTGRIADGLRKQGFYTLAEQLENRIINTVNICGYNLEYVYVGARGDLENVVAYNIRAKNHEVAEPLSTAERKVVEIASTNIPQAVQTWTASCVAAIIYRREHPELQEDTLPGSWQDMLEKQIMGDLTKRGAVQELLQTQEEIDQAKANGYLFIVDKEQGERLQEELVIRSEETHKDNKAFRFAQ